MTDDAAPAETLPGFDPVPQLAQRLGLAPRSIAAVVAMLDEGSTVPFIARYRKEKTGGLDEVQIRAIEETRTYVVELEARRAAILASIGEQGKLTPELEAKIKSASAKTELEDLYAPYRQRRKTRASVAREKGLEPLAAMIAGQGAEGNPAEAAAAYIKEAVEGGAGAVASADEALAGARDIVAEQIADTAEIRTWLRRMYSEHGELVSALVAGKDAEPTKFEQYYNFGEAVKTIPSHRFLAIRRGEAEGVLRASVKIDETKVEAGIDRMVRAKLPDGSAASPWAGQMALAVTDSRKRLLAPSIENDVRAELKTRSDVQAVDVFAQNLRNLMLAAPLGTAAVVGVDPGLRTGCKCAAIDATGKFLGTVTLFITQGEAQAAKAKADFVAFVQQWKPRAIAVGNGTGGREAEAFVKGALKGVEWGEGGAAPFVVQVNEAGASVYSASDLAREEFPELDLTIRGAISIARRLQDPLAELVKIEPKSIGVGQYQHDVHQPLLGKKLGDVVESCVNHVGVELNTASAMLLGYVAGIGKALAKKIVLHRDAHGAFASRAQLMEVAGLGPKAFEQSAGFLRIALAANPLDRSAVHPERYGVVAAMAADLGVAAEGLIGNAELVDKVELGKYVDEAAGLGEPTLKDIAAELRKPGRDPRAEFAPPAFRDDVTSMDDLKQGMVLEGVVTNVTAFGAFVDIGVHNDGLVHVSQLSDQFVQDPAAVVKVGQKLTVRVLEVDLARKRISLTAKKAPAPKPPREPQAQRPPRGQHQGQRHQGQPHQGQQGQQQPHQGDGPRQYRGGGGGGPRNDGPRNDGPRNNGPRNDGPRNDGPRNDGPRNDGPREYRGGPRNEGPRNDGPRNDGPRNDGPPRSGDRGPRRNDGPRNDGPRNDGPRNDGPRNDGPPRRDDRGGPPPRRDEPRRDEQPVKKPENWGVSGFTNNPFTKLTGKK